MTRRINPNRLDLKLETQSWKLVTIRKTKKPEKCHHCGITFDIGDNAISHGRYFDRKKHISQRKLLCSGCYNKIWYDFPDPEDDE